MNHPVLDLHASIAWDLDGTILDGRNSQFFREYILAHPEKQHHIVTFRDPAGALLGALKLGSLGVGPDLITSVNGCPTEVYGAWGNRRKIYDKDAVGRYLEWKGQKSAEHGCTVLVDDMPSQVVPGCNKFGVAFLNSLDPI
jgi:hypothetical protein